MRAECTARAGPSAPVSSAQVLQVLRVLTYGVPVPAPAAQNLHGAKVLGIHTNCAKYGFPPLCGRRVTLEGGLCECGGCRSTLCSPWYAGQVCVA